MRKALYWSIFISIMLIVGLLLAACDEVEPEAESSDTGDDARVASVPTRTVKPIVSFTPRFTATPIPSATFTPSTTPQPTETPVPASPTPTITPSPTPTVSGVIQSTSDRVNLRSGPGFGDEIVVSVPNATELGVVGYQEDPAGLGWYKVAYTDNDGQTQLLWVRSTLLDTNYAAIVAAPSVTPAAVADADNANEADDAGDAEDSPAASNSAAGTATRTPGPTPPPERIDILAYCRQKGVNPPRITTNDEVYIEWSWYVAREDLMQQHLDNSNYEVRLDGELIEGWERYASEVKRESGVWIIYWFVPVGTLEPGEHKVTYLLTWDDAITDGYDDFGPGTPIETNEGNCVFTVEEPS